MSHPPATRRALLGAAALGASGLSLPALAQTRFPSREITWLIYQAPGGSIDLTARLIQPYLAEQGVRTNLDYAVGAGGRIARTRVFRARNDGYTMMTESSPGAVMDELLRGAEYKAMDFESIFGWSVIGWQFCAKKDSPIRSVADWVAEARRRRVTVGTIGRGGSSHLQVEIVKKALGINFDVVHFDGSGRLYPAVLGGHVDIGCAGPASASRNRDNLHFVALTRKEPALPEVPTFEEQGFPGVLSANQLWYALTTPGTPPERAERIEEAFRKAFENPELNERMRRAGEAVVLLSRAQLREAVAEHHRMVQENRELMA